jgi:hypothetical protein
MQGCRREDHTTNIEKTPSGCGGWSGKSVDELEKDEGTGWSKLGRIGMMGEWMEVGTHLCIPRANY